MGNTSSINKLNFQALQTIINKQTSEFIIISTLPEDNQGCLIANTISPSQEYQLLNQYIKTNLSIKIVIYGENSTDNSVIDKYNQLYKLGFKNVPNIKPKSYDKKKLWEMNDFQKRRLESLNEIEKLMNEISPLISNAKNNTIEQYSADVGSYDITEPIEVVLSYLKEIKELLIEN